jgi:LysM repeat protein
MGFRSVTEGRVCRKYAPNALYAFVMTSLPRSRSASGLLALGLAASVLTGCGLGGGNSKTTASSTTLTKAKGATTVPASAASTVFATLPPVPTTAPAVTLAPGSTGTLTTGAPTATPGVTQPPAAPAPSGTKYVVKAGDIPSRIALAMGVSTQALLDANGLTAKDFIKIGDQLVVPAGGTLPAGGTIAPPAATVPTTTVAGKAPVAPAGSSKYTVVANDSWYGIAKKFGVTPDSLLAANGATTKTQINPGQVIVIPGKAAAATPAVTTTVKKP